MLTHKSIQPNGKGSLHRSLINQPHQQSPPPQHNRSKGKGTTMGRKGKKMKKKGKEVETANIINKKLLVNKSTTTCEEVYLSSRVNSHRTSRDHLASAGSFKPKLNCCMVTAQPKNTWLLEAWSGCRQHHFCCNLLPPKTSKHHHEATNQTIICETK